MPKKSSKQIVSQQSKLFVEKARELGCDDDESAFDKTLKKIASAPPPKTAKKRTAKKS